MLFSSSKKINAIQEELNYLDKALHGLLNEVSVMANANKRHIKELEESVSALEERILLLEQKNNKKIKK